MLRSTLFLVGVCLSLTCAAPSGAQQDELQAYLDKVIKAHGGEAKLRSSMATHVKAKGKINADNNEFSVTLEGYFQLPDKIKLVMELDLQGKNLSVVVVLDGKDAFANVMGKPDKVPEELLKELKTSLYREYVTRLVPLKDKSFALSSLGEVKIDDKDAVGLQVTKQGYPDMNLYFDKTTHLLVKAEYRAVEPSMKQEVDQVRRLSDYKEFGGIRLATKIVLDNAGKRFAELEITELRVVEKHDAAIFGKP